MKDVNELLNGIAGSLELVGELTPERIAALLAQTASIQIALAARLLQRPPARQIEDNLSMAGQLLTVDQAAERLCFTPQYLYELVRKGQFSSVRCGKYVRIPLADLVAWIDGHREKKLDGILYDRYSYSMDGKELLEIRKSLGLTQVGMAEAIGVRANTVARWERGELRISEPLSRFIRLLAKTAPVQKQKNKQR